tara:strand:+ start:4807 stop:5163 length:357 start_codon:yes stop_codon:yes gene_type:complete
MTKRSYYSLPVQGCIERINDCLKRRKVVKAFIQTSNDDEDAWNSELMMLLCEYYSINCRYAELMSEIILSPAAAAGTTGEELVTVDVTKYSILSSYSKLMIVDEAELKYGHGINLFIH